MQQLSNFVESYVSVLMTAGRGNSEKGRHGDVCDGAYCTLCFYAICICGEEDTWILITAKNWDFWIQSSPEMEKHRL